MTGRLGAVCKALSPFVVLALSTTCAAWTIPPQSVYIDQLQYNVLGSNSTLFRGPTGYFNPQNLTPPFFQIFNEGFFHILGESPSIQLITENDSYAFAHEAPVYLPEKNELWFSSNDGGPLGMSDWYNDNKIWKINLTEAEAGNATLYEVPINPPLEMTNGGTLYMDGQPLFIQSGRAELPPTLALVNPSPPYNSTVILDNFYGRQFNSLNDVKIHPVSKAIFFTDVTYGWLNQFRPMPLLPNQVYRFDPVSGAVRVVADGFDRCNGIAFSIDGSLAYIADTGASGGFLGNNATQPATMYEFDVDPQTQRFLNRRVFAYMDTGVPDGIQLDAEGNIYTGTGDGVQIWNPNGVLLGKIFTASTVAEMIFVGDGRMIVLDETKLYLVRFAAQERTLNFWN